MVLLMQACESTFSKIKIPFVYDGLDRNQSRRAKLDHTVIRFSGYKTMTQFDRVTRETLVFWNSGYTPVCDPIKPLVKSTNKNDIQDGVSQLEPQYSLLHRHFSC